MKTQTSFFTKMILVSAFIVLIISVKASNYDEAMGKALQTFAQASTAEQLLASADQFERIGKAEQNQWLPYYYGALACVQVVMRNSDVPKKQRESVLDRAQVLVDQSMAINSNESEVYVLQGFIYQLKISNPMEGASLSMKATSTLAKAEALNPENPRVYYAQGTNVLYTPKAFGGGPDKAKPLFQKAQKLFESQSVSNPLLPNWGPTENDYMLKKCGL
jgi:hypothetical protein